MRWLGFTTFHRPGLTIGSADDRTRRDSHLTTSSVNAPLRSDTLTTLPPCSSSQPKPTQSESTQHAKTPADLLGLSIQHVRKLSETEVPHFELGTLFSDSKGISATPQTSPNALRPLAEHDEPSGFHSKQDLKRLGQGQNTINEVALSQTGAGISSALPELSIGVSRVSTSPTASSRRTSTTEATTSTSKRGSIFAPEYAVVELVMENLIGVQASFYRTKHYRYNVSRVESFRNKQTGRRYVIISPPESFKIKLYFGGSVFLRSLVHVLTFCSPVLPTERVIAHSEHPQAYGSSNTYRVKFIEPHILRSQKISSERRTSDFSSVPPPSFTPVSSATSGASSTSPASPVLNIDMGLLKEESRRQEYDFENEEDYRRFQEMLMGPGVKLQLQVPIQSISVKRFNAGNSAEESRLQYLRLWQYGRRQTLMFFANLTSSKYREYQMENLRPIESKSKTSIRLDVHLPGMVRRRSSSKSPILVAKSPAQEQARLGGYADENDLSDLNYLLIEFSSAQGRPEFLREARFHSSPEDLMASPSSFCSKSPT